jgi:hypothetical protein
MLKKTHLADPYQNLKVRTRGQKMKMPKPWGY